MSGSDVRDLTARNVQCKSTRGLHAIWTYRWSRSSVNHYKSQTEERRSCQDHIYSQSHKITARSLHQQLLEQLVPAPWIMRKWSSPNSSLFVFRSLRGSPLCTLGHRRGATLSSSDTSSYQIAWRRLSRSLDAEYPGVVPLQLCLCSQTRSKGPHRLAVQRSTVASFHEDEWTHIIVTVVCGIVEIFGTGGRHRFICSWIELVSSMISLPGLWFPETRERGEKFRLWLARLPCRYILAPFLPLESTTLLSSASFTAGNCLRCYGYLWQERNMHSWALSGCNHWGVAPVNGTELKWKGVDRVVLLAGKGRGWRRGSE